MHVAKCTPPHAEMLVAKCTPPPMQYCEVSVESTNCSCPDDSIRTEFRAAMTPMTFVFPISGLGAYTLYCVQSVGRYREISGKTVPGGEVTSGQGRADKSSTTMGERTAVCVWAACMCAYLCVCVCVCVVCVRGPVCVWVCSHTL